MTPEQFWSKVAFIPFHTCWEWVGATNGRYGTFSSRKYGVTYAHRFSWELHNNRKIPDGFFVLHSCDNATCVNPHHLRIGTPKENTADMFSRNRQMKSCGENRPMAKLKEAQVTEIRNSSLSHAKLARLYGVSANTIASIRKRKKWKHI